MTNEEIEKRFLFDLEMGRFDIYTNTQGVREIRFIVSRYLIRKFMTLLENLNYSYKEWHKCFIDVNDRLIRIFLNSKKFWIQDVNTHVRYECLNSTPNYIKEYMI